MRAIQLCLLIHVLGGTSASKDFFVTTFQDGIKNIDIHDDQQWMEYTNEIPDITDFTACHWMNIRYFSKELMPIWSYCMIGYNNNDTECVQISFEPLKESRNRNLKTEIFLPWYRIRGRKNKDVELHLKPFKHRAWNHVCWSYSSKLQCHTLYYNGVKVDEECMKEEVNITKKEIPGSKSVRIHSVIIGQEQDEAGTTKFDSRQTINGKLTEINIWSELFNDTKIHDLSRCKSFPKGDILSWMYNRFTFHNVTTERFENLRFLCDEQKTLMISTKRHTFKEAKDVCRTHGGQLIVPQSPEENAEVVKVLKKHENSCLIHESCMADRFYGRHINEIHKCYEDEPVSWLGIYQIEKDWFEVDNKSKSVMYDNWDTSGTASGWGNAKCAYMKGNSEWRYGTDNKCESVVLKLCPVCYIFGTPVFTMKSLEDKMWVDYNFYMVLDNSSQVEYYEGYKNAEIVKEKGSWKIRPKLPNPPQENVELPITNSTLSPTGRHQWYYYALGSEIKNAKKCENVKNRTVPFSHCWYGEEFTCTTGGCVEKSKRCNHAKDCIDGSDEEYCSPILIPPEYLDTKPPQNGTLDLVKLNTSINILSIDSIDTDNMVVALTFEIRVRWIDSRLTYNNLVENTNNFIPSREASGIWLPLDNIIFVDSVVRETFKDETKELSVRASKSNGTNAENGYEDSYYNGTNNEIKMAQIFKVSYKCIFDLYQFPFDHTHCNFSLKMRRVEKLTSILVEDYPAIMYKGTEKIHQFQIGKRTSSVTNTNESTIFTFKIELRRNYMHQMFATYFPTFLLWLLTYSTLFIDVNDFDNRFQGSVTAMLVLAALLNSITSSLPQTSYLKLIDIWFFCHTISIFSLIMFHIILAKVRKNSQYKIYEKQDPVIQNGFTETNIDKNSTDESVGPEDATKENTSKDNEDGSLFRCCTRIQLNRGAIILLPIISLSFYVFYFIHTKFYFL